MDRFILMGNGRAWDNQLYCFSNSWVRARTIPWGQTGSKFCILFSNCSVEYYPCWYYININGELIKITLPEYLSNYLYNLYVNDQHISLKPSSISVVSSIFKSVYELDNKFSCGIPNRKLKLCYHGVEMYESNVCLFELWALILDNDYNVEAIVVYDGCDEHKLSVYKVVYSLNGKLHRYITFASGMVQDGFRSSN